jgi:hypothetical protein
MLNIFANPPAFADQTVTTDNHAAMLNAAKFQQSISAYPNSQLAKNYQAAITQSSTAADNSADGSANSSDNVADSITGATDAFFKGTKSFQNVTLADVVAVQSYYNTFPFAWAQYSGSVTYYLYSSDGTATSFVGTLSLAKSGAVDITQPNGGYTCTFTPATNPSDTTSVDVNTAQAKSLTYTGGLFVDDVSADIPMVAVKGIYQLKSQITRNPDDAQIIPLLTGSVNGVTIFGTDSPQKSNDPSSSFWKTLFEPKGATQIFNSIMQIGGALMLIHFLGSTSYAIYKWAKSRGAAKEPTTQELLDKQTEALEKTINDKVDAAFKKLSNDPKAEAPKSPEEALDDAAKLEDNVAANGDAIKIQDSLQSESAILEVEAQFIPEMSSGQIQSLESLASDVQSIQGNLSQATPETIVDVVATQKTALSDLSDSSAQLTEDLGNTIGAQEQANISTERANSDAITEQMDKMDTENETSKTSDNPSEGDDFPDVPEL